MASNDSVTYKESTQLLNEFDETMGRIKCLWEKLGIGEERMKDRSNAALQYVISCISEMEESEESLYNSIVDRIEDYTRQLQILASSLGVHPIEVEDSLTLIDKENFLRSHLDALNQEKHSRMKSLQDFRKIEKNYCLMLSMPPHEISSVSGVPTEQDLSELERHIKMLKDERERRYQKFFRAKRELSTIMESTEIIPETAFEREVICYEDDQFLLSSENLKELDTFVSKIQSKKAKLVEEKENLLEKLTSLWNRLDIDDEERRAFLSSHSDVRISTINEIKEEIDRCQELKMQNMASYIQLLKVELQGLWKNCYISVEEQEHFLVVWDDEFTEMALEAYESAVQKMKIYQKETEEICRKIEERQRLWDLMTEFENKACDPNRFNNRGGKLLQEERERRKLQKDLPKLENELFVLIEKYEEANGSQFLFKGENFQVHVQNQWEQRMNEKENEKLLRQKHRTLMVEHEMTMGTPIGKRPLSGVPKSAPSKMFKSNAGPSVLHTPKFNTRMKTPETTGKFKGSKAKTPQRSSPRFASTKRNPRKSLLMSKSEKKKSAGSPNSTSYSTFAKELNRTARTDLRSSVLSNRKVLGGKVACLRNRRSGGSSRNKSASLRNTSKAAPKLTPVGGKLGLPFII